MFQAGDKAGQKEETMRKLKTKYDREKEEQMKLFRIAQSALAKLATGDYPVRGRMYATCALKALLALETR